MCCEDEKKDSAFYIIKHRVLPFVAISTWINLQKDRDRPTIVILGILTNCKAVIILSPWGFLFYFPSAAFPDKENPIKRKMKELLCLGLEINIEASFHI